MVTKREFRFVIVGAGSAGCLLARLLAKRQSEPVAVVEAGGAGQDVRSAVPSYYPRTFGSSLDWNFATVPQAGLGQRRISWPRGKTVGGSGAINALIYMQAAAADFAYWGWSPTTTTSSNPVSPSAARVAPDTAPLHLAPLESPHPWTAGFLEAAQTAGLRRIDSWTQSVENSCGYFQLTQRQGRRCHTGHLLRLGDDASPSAPVELFTAATVRRIVLRGERACGVEWLDAAGQLQCLAASGEVILCAGTIGSPSLLLASGIGAAAKLQAEQICCQHDLPAVGQHLQDHLVYPLIYSTHSNQGLPRRHVIADRQRYRAHGQGPLASNIAEAGALFSTGDAPASRPVSSQADIPSQPDFQIHFTATHYLKYPRLDSGDHYLTLGITDLHPHSCGELRLVRQASPGATGMVTSWQPRIDPRYLNEPVDGQRLLQAIAWTRHLCQHNGLSELIQQEALPGSKRSDERGLLKSVQTFAQSIYHPVGTCRMDSALGAGCNETVVDSNFRVHGLTGLRVVDASVLPSLPSCNTNAITLWLATQALEKICN